MGDSYAVKLQHLIQTVHPPDRGPYTYREIAEGIKAAGGKITSVYLNQLAIGKRDNPSMASVQAVAQFFGVPVAYFFDEQTCRAVDQELADLAIWRDEGTRNIAQRALGLSPEQRAVVSDVIDSLERQRTTPRAQRKRRKSDQ